MNAEIDKITVECTLQENTIKVITKSDKNRANANAVISGPDEITVDNTLQKNFSEKTAEPDKLAVENRLQGNASVAMTETYKITKSDKNHVVISGHTSEEYWQKDD